MIFIITMKSYSSFVDTAIIILVKHPNLSRVSLFKFFLIVVLLSRIAKLFTTNFLLSLTIEILLGNIFSDVAASLIIFLPKHRLILFFASMLADVKIKKKEKIINLNNINVN